MKIEKIKNRGILFTQNLSEWDLNIYLINGEKYNYLIDTGLGSLSVDPVRKYIDHNKQTIVINTHYHWDHIWGNSSLQNSIIISHKLCAELIQSKWDEMLQRNNQYCHGKVEKYLPNLLFEKELYFPEDEIRLFYTPGHTVDSISILDEKEKVLFVGDNVGDTLDELVPNINSDKEIYINTLKEYERLDFDLCLSGHNIVLEKDVISKILSII